MCCEDREAVGLDFKGLRGLYHNKYLKGKCALMIGGNIFY